MPVCSLRIFGITVRALVHLFLTVKRTGAQKKLLNIASELKAVAAWIMLLHHISSGPGQPTPGELCCILLHVAER